MASASRGTVTSIDQGNHRSRIIARRNNLVEQHLKLVPPIAKRIAEMLPPSFDLDDLISTGNVALIHAATTYRPREHGDCPFSAYARHRIRGAILDSVRRRHFTDNTHESIDAIPVHPIAAQLTEEGFDQDLVMRRLTKVMERLSGRQQALLNRYYRDDLNRLKQMHFRRRKKVILTHHHILQILRRELTLATISREPVA